MYILNQLFQLLGVLILLACVLGFFFSIFSSTNDRQEKLLKDIRDELHKKNKQNEPKEGRVV